MDDPNKINSTLDDTNILIQAVHEELIALRGAFGELNIQKFSQYPTLRAVCGGNVLADDYLVFNREMVRIVAEANRDEAAAALSTTAPEELMLLRLWYVVEHFPSESGEIWDQRTGRRWSERGMPNVAAELVHLAKMKGWLGKENLALELSGNREARLLDVWYFFSEDIDGPAPTVSLWKITGDEVNEESVEWEHTLRHYKIFETHYKSFRLEHYRIWIALPVGLVHPQQNDGKTVLIISIDTIGAPMRTLTFVDETDLGKDLEVEFSVYRELAMIELRKRTPDPLSRPLEVQSDQGVD